MLTAWLTAASPSAQASDPPTRLPPRPLAVRTVTGVPYVEGADADPAHHLDLYVPETPERSPVLIWIHGGAWAVGSTAQERAVATRIAEQGIVVAAIDHRRSPATWIDPTLDDGVVHPAHVSDCARAIAWLRAEVDAYGGDPERLVVGGFSSGGHLAALLAVDPRYLRAAGLEPEVIRAAVPVAGAYDLEAYYVSHVEGNGQEMADSHVLGVFGEQALLRDASPTTHLDPDDPPMLVISETDTYDYTRVLEELAQTMGATSVELRHVRDVNHAGLHRALGQRDDPTSTAISDYVHRVTTQP